MKYVWDASAWADYVYWPAHDRKIARRINELLKELAQDLRDGSSHEDIGEPEGPKHGLFGYQSRRITDEHRLIYRIVGSEIRIAACRYHHSP